MRTDGVVIFDGLFKSAMELSLAGLDDAAIGQAFSPFSSYPRNSTSALLPREEDQITFHRAYDLGRAVVTKYSESVDVKNLHNFKPATLRQANRFLHEDVSYAVFEGVRSMTMFPVNLARAARAQFNSEQPDGVFYKGLPGLAALFRSEFFKQNCNDAAFTANGIWGGLSTDQSEPHQFDLYNRSEPLFLFDGTYNDPRFELSPQLQRHLRRVLKDRNGAHLGRSLRNRPQYDTSLEGSSSGCPVRRTLPHNVNRTTDQLRLADLALQMGHSCAELAAPHTQSAISWGLDQLANLYDRAHSN